MPQVLLGIGSNIEPERHLIAAAQAIRSQCFDVQFSSVYQSQAVGMDGDDFLNTCCLLSHHLPNESFSRWLKDLEDKHGRDRSEGSWKPRTLDLDILMVDGAVVDDDMYRYAHAFVPASELVQLKPLQDAVFAPVVKVDLTL